MNTTTKILIGLLCFSIVSCDREIALSPGVEDFQVTTDKTVYRVNEEVMFHFEGDPDMISFYSGELYNDYAYRESRVIDLQKTIVNFTSQHPVLAGSQESEFKILLSTDFNDAYSYDNLVNATWRDITNEFALGVANQFVASGDYEISTLYETGKPLYLAFRYSNLPQDEHGFVRRFLIENVQFLAESVYETHVLGNMTTSDFRIVEKNENAITASLLAATRITFNGYERSEDDLDPETDTWVVTKAFDLEKIDNGPDRAVALKGNQDPLLTSHIHAFSKAGEYTVTFIGTNANVHGLQQVVRQVKITVEEGE